MERWTEQARRLGFDVLINEGRQIDCGGGRIALAGTTDFSAGELVPDHASDPAKALAASDGADVRILLAHQPRSIEAASRAACHLQLSGHTHGGQFVPWKYVVSLQQPYVAGLHKFRDTWIYIHRGNRLLGSPTAARRPFRNRATYVESGRVLIFRRQMGYGAPFRRCPRYFAHLT